MDAHQLALNFAGLKEINDEERYYNHFSCQRYESFIEGYNAACEWKDMSTAPKDGTYILVSDEKGFVHKASWDLDGFFEKINNYDWCIADSQDRDEGFHSTINPVAWMPLPKYTHKP